MGALFVLVSPVRAQAPTSMTYSGTTSATWTGITADWDGPLDLSTSLKFTVTLNQSIETGDLGGAANGTGTLSGSWSINDPEYPSDCPTQVTISGSYTFEVEGQTNFTGGLVSFYGYGPSNWVENDSPQPGPDCWPGVSVGGIPETYTQNTIENFLGDCFSEGGPCSQFPLNGGTNSNCTDVPPLATCNGTDTVNLVSSTTGTTTTSSTSSSSTTTSTSGFSTTTTATSSSSTASTSTATAPTAATTSSSTTTATTTTSSACDTMYIYEGLAPAAPTSGGYNIYVGIHWDGQTPARVALGAFSGNPSIAVSFAFNPVTMYSADTKVLTTIKTQHTADGTYTINFAAQLTDPQSGQPCNVGIKALVTVSGTTVFVEQQNQQAEAIWLQNLSSPFMVSGNIMASQYSDFVPTLGANGRLTDLAFTVTGPPNTQGVGTLTIPKALVAPGFIPVLSIDSIQARITVTQDSTNFYITYTTRFSTHTVVLSFVQPGGNTTTSSVSLSTSGSTTNGNPSQPSGFDMVTMLIPWVIAGAFVMAGIALFVLVLRSRRMGHWSNSARAAPGFENRLSK